MCTWAVAMLLQSCGENKVATECYHLQEALLENSFIPVGTVTKSTEIAQAKTAQRQADAIAQVDLSDEDLTTRRDEMVTLLQQQSDLSLQAADVMTEDGFLGGRKSADYERISQRRRKLIKQMYAAQNGLRIHCSLQ